MNIKKQNYYIALTATVLLLGVGLYHFIFERQRYWWVMLLTGALLNLYIAYTQKEH